MRYDKLVRDGIIAKIEAKGESAKWHEASESEYREKLHEKLGEEVNEFLESSSPEEMADILEVVAAIISNHGWTMRDIIEIQQKKREKNGAFEKRIILEES